MLLSRDASQFLGTADLPSPTPDLDPYGYRHVPVLNSRPTLLGLLISFMVFAWMCSLLRLYTRFFIFRRPGWDDLFIILTMLSTATGSIILCILPNLGLGRSVYTMTVPEVEQFMRILYICNATFPLSSTLIKLALLFQYLRVFKPGSRSRLFSKVMIAVTAAWGVAFIILRWVPCYPVSSYWNASVKDPHCWGFGSRNPHAFARVFVGQASSTVFLDLIVFAIPLPLCFKPDTPRKTRICLVGLFILGFLTISCAILRMAFVIQRSKDSSFRFDPSWYSATTGGLTCLEVHLAAVCAALPVFWPVLATSWGIFVTTEVSVTREYGRIHPKTNREGELRSTSSHGDLARASNEPRAPESWEPFVGDDMTGLGENETVVEASAAAKRGIGQWLS